MRSLDLSDAPQSVDEVMEMIEAALEEDPDNPVFGCLQMVEGETGCRGLEVLVEKPKYRISLIVSDDDHNNDEDRRRFRALTTYINENGLTDLLTIDQPVRSDFGRSPTYSITFPSEENFRAFLEHFFD